MTPSEAVQELDSMASGDDTRSSHERADRILLLMLKQWGSPELFKVATAWINAHERVGFWCD